MTDHPHDGRRTRERWFPVLALVAVATMVNYLDRTVLGIAAPYLTRELGLTAASLGIVFSAFSWSYALLQIPGGIFLDRFGTRTTYALALTLWSAFTGLMGLVQGLPGLVLTRIGVGVFEAPCFPANSRILATWFPQHERARANSIYSVGPVRRDRVPERAALLGDAAVRLAQPVLPRRRPRHPARRADVVALPRAQREPDGERGGTGAHRGRRRRRVQGRTGRVQLALHRVAVAPPPGARRVDRPVRWQFHPGVLRHLVSHLPRHRPRHGLPQRRADDHAARTSAPRSACWSPGSCPIAC